MADGANNAGAPGAGERPRLLTPYRYGPRWSDVWIEQATGVLFALALIAPRGAFAYLAILLAVCLIGAWFQRSRDAEAPAFPRGAGHAWHWYMPAVVFLLHAALSSTWSVLPGLALRKTAEVAVMLAIVWGLLRAFEMFDAATRRVMMRGLVHGGFVGVAYIGIEHATDGALKAWAINTTGWLTVHASFNIVRDGVVVSVERTFLNRHSAALAILIWPMLYGAQVWLRDTPLRRRLVQISLAVAAVVLVALSNSETAKLAFILGGLTFLAAQFRRRLVAVVLALAWIVSALGAPLLVSTLALPAERLVAPYNITAAARLQIWQHTIERTQSRPLTGHGAAMTEPLGDLEPAQEGWRRLDNHAHNAFVQIWFELGAIGAVLMCLLGGAVLWAATRLSEWWQPWAFAQVASVASVAATGYGFWQMWLLAFFALALSCAVLATGTGVAGSQGRDRHG